ncbi:VWA domain-containing protein [Hydrogenophaga sp.]|uniref:vWA domain-containing protein n=1 Tax=Hydrogenophaga sp. TaxID=1904254 RepID=UPI00271BCC74|nr:VWA domain-containing protein [Hydrogenophaga sp.]MDO9437781.1 VWA domain-containing protein [Hydrogenophaga sp.]
MILGDARSGKLPDHITAFGRALRRAGVPVDSSRVVLAITAAEMVGVDRRDDLRAALEAVMVSRQQDIGVFGEMFDAFFRNPELAQQLLSQMLPKAAKANPVRRKARVQEALSVAGLKAQTPNQGETELKLDAAMTASDQQRLRHADFAGLSASEFRLVEQLVRDIPLPLPPVRSRRERAASRGHRPNWARALQEARRLDGELLRVPMMTRRPQPLPLLILVDISGSMERYARLLLAFLHQATRGTPRSAFAFGTDLTDLRPAFRHSDTDQMLEMANDAIADFAGGTRLGESLAQLRTRHKRCLVGRRTVVLLITDGLDTGTPEQLEEELQWLGRHSRQLLWLNPLLRFDGYAPLATGASVLHRHAHGMLAVHNLSRLEDLARSMAALMQRG